MSNEEKSIGSVDGQLDSLAEKIVSQNGVILLRVHRAGLAAETQWKDGARVEKLVPRRDLFESFDDREVPWGDCACLVSDESEFQEEIQDLIVELERQIVSGSRWLLMIEMSPPEEEEGVTEGYRLALADGNLILGPRSRGDIWNVKLD